MLPCEKLGINKLKFNSTVEVSLNDGRIFIGKYSDWTSDEDNDSQGESITVEKDGVQYELFLTEIKFVNQIN